MISAGPIARAAGFVLLSFLLYGHCNGVAAWQSGIRRHRMAKATTTELLSHPNNGCCRESLPSPRRQFLFQIAGTAVLSAAVVPPHRANAAAAATADADSARDQWRQGSNAIDDLLKNWSTEEWAEKTSGGDVVRVQLGRLDTTSPLFKIEKAFKVLRDSELLVDADEIEFVETSEAFMEALYRADSFATDANLKTGSGKQTPPTVSLENAKKEVVGMQSIAKKLNAMVK